MSQFSQITKFRNTIHRMWRCAYRSATRQLNKAIKIFSILATESHANIRFVLPSAIAWAWRKYVYREIKTIRMTADTTEQVAYLNIHGGPAAFNSHKVHAVLFSHGDYGHPSSMLHLVDIALKEGMTIFSIYIPGVANDEHFEIHCDFIEQALDKIEKFVQDHNGSFAGVLGAGHSKGATLLAQKQFVNLDERIKATYAVGGRLNALDDKESSDGIMTRIVRKIYEGIISNPSKPVVQIVPRDDWNASQEAMAVRPHDHCHSVPGMHLSGLYSDEARSHFTQFLREFSQ